MGGEGPPPINNRNFKKTDFCLGGWVGKTTPEEIENVEAIVCCFFSSAVVNYSIFVGLFFLRGGWSEGEGVM